MVYSAVGTTTAPGGCARPAPRGALGGRRAPRRCPRARPLAARMSLHPRASL